MGRGTTVVASLIIGLTVPACGAPDGRPAAADDLLYMRTNLGVAMVQAGAAAPAYHSVLAEPDPQWRTVVNRELVDSSTRLTAMVPTTNEQLWTREIPGSFVIKVVSPDARFVALAPDTQRYYAKPEKSRVIVTGRDITAPISIELEGNFEPEAFSTDGSNLFVVQYRPATDPTTYQVRRLDLTTGQVHDVFTVDAELQQEMRGTARVQEMSPDGTRLYTLYTLKTPHGSHSFVHVLALDEMWAHCIDLPGDFLLDGEARAALGVSPDGETVYVADTRGGKLASLDAQDLQVRRWVSMDLASASRGADLTVSVDGRSVLVASGSRLVAASASDLSMLGSWDLEERIRGIQSGADGRAVYVARDDDVVVIDLGLGKQIERFEPPGVTRIHDLGPATKGLDEARIKIICGC
jgi:hypothetical protein